MNVSLTPELENLVNEQVKSGLYNSASEVVREGLRLFKEQLILKEIRRDELRGEFVEVKASELDAFADKLIREAKDEFNQRNGK